MSLSDIPILSMLRTRMQWHQERQRVLAENVANAETPHYVARDLVPPNFENVLQQSGSLTMVRTNPGHLAAVGDESKFAEGRDRHYEVRPRGTAVSHEDEMLKLAGNQMDYDAVAALYTHSLALIKTAV